MTTTRTNENISVGTTAAPSSLCSPFAMYPNPFGVTDDDRRAFHPVVTFPSDQPVRVAGLDSSINVVDRCLATEEEREDRRQQQKATTTTTVEEVKEDWWIGRYDENREAVYTSDLFAVVTAETTTTTSEQQQQHRRTLHVGIDLGGPVGTPVYAFSDGVVHKVGYNPALGDYGNVIVVKHELEQQQSKTIVMYALYGHLDQTTLEKWNEGGIVKKGDVLGGMGDIHENGGWFFPHVHFQLSTAPPETHDLPGAVRLCDRQQALQNYPDPRCILGPDLY